VSQTKLIPQEKSAGKYRAQTNVLQHGKIAESRVDTAAACDLAIQPIKNLRRRGTDF